MSNHMPNHKIILIIFCCFCASLCHAQNYRILLTNDDGIESPLLIALADKLADEFDIVVSAPRENQSGSAHASNSSTPLTVEKIYRGDTLFGYGVHGRPADAARFGILQLGKDKPFDVVVSGINRGANVGNVAHLSGTVGAAMEGLYQGIPAIAVSQDPRADTAVSIRLTRQVIKQFQQQGAPKGTMISINVPAGDIKQVVAKPMGGSYLGYQPYTTTTENGNSTTYASGLTIQGGERNDNDTKAYQEGVATITPLKFDWTDYALLETLKSWQLQVTP